jgi:Tfp pilus assembly protein PilF
MTVIRRVIFAAGALFLCSLPQTRAFAACSQPAGRLVSVQGQVEVGEEGRQDWRAGQLDAQLCRGDTVRVGARSRAALALVNDAVLRIDQNTTLRLIDVAGQATERSWLELIKGAIQSFSRKPRLLTVNTPYLNGSIEGTEFVFRVEGEESQLTVFEGTVVAANDQGSLPVPGGSSVAAARGQAPQPRIVVRPRDEVQWSLYYPAVFAQGQAPPGAASEVLQAAELLKVGRVDEARATLDRVLRANPGVGEAYALLAVIEVVQNQPQQAQATAEKALALGDSAAASVALSYAQQANFRIEAARDTLRAAVAKHPDDALAWARLGELELMLGNRRTAVEAAAKAGALAPDLARPQLVLGFAELAQYHNDQAQAAFTRVQQLESADPLGHLGLGLARISDGQLAEGRQELEVAVSLDSTSALLRSYLGKAYFTEKRDPLDAQQYAIAKQLDPNDPTAYLYDGILKQTENRPVEALQDLEASSARNDNRAVYRSRLLLDQDRAARGVSQARVYSDLGFDALGVEAAADSLALDPANASAHRFLSDSLRTVRRREISRVSELLQAQLLQDTNVNPIQPSVSEANLNIVTVGGPAGAGFNEFTPLFQRNQTQVDVATFGGNNSTLGGEAVATAQYGRFSVSAGAFGYDTDGWRPNNGLDQQIYTAFFQAALTDELNVQAEFRHRESKEGDLPFNFDPDDFIPDKTIRRDQDTTRVGLRYTPKPGANLLFSYIHTNRKEGLDQSQTFDPFTIGERQRQRSDGDQYEAQYIQQLEQGRFLLGAAYISTDQHDNTALTFDAPLLGILEQISESSTTEIRQPRGYGYLNLHATPQATWTLGVSADQFEQGDLHVNSINPKLGVRWAVMPGLELRAAATKTVKPALTNNQNIEPTQVAGFNQFFDDLNGTKSWRYAGAVDWQVMRSLALGIEASARQLDEPIFDATNVAWVIEDRHEQLHRAYVYWTPSERLAVRGELVYDQYKSLASLDLNLPELVRTVSLPLGIRYFDPSGFFGGVTITGVDQRVTRSPDATEASGDSDFVVTDLALGYRFPKRRGMASVAVMNLFDQDFEYQDDSYREFRTEPSTGPYFPTRTIVMRLGLSF